MPDGCLLLSVMEQLQVFMFYLLRGWEKTAAEILMHLVHKE